MAFSKFDPDRPEKPDRLDAAGRRALLLKYGWAITSIYTAFGFLMIAYFLFWR